MVRRYLVLPNGECFSGALKVDTVSSESMLKMPEKYQIIDVQSVPDNVHVDSDHTQSSDGMDEECLDLSVEPEFVKEVCEGEDVGRRLDSGNRGEEDDSSNSSSNNDDSSDEDVSSEDKSVGGPRRGRTISAGGGGGCSSNGLRSKKRSGLLGKNSFDILDQDSKGWSHMMKKSLERGRRGLGTAKTATKLIKEWKRCQKVERRFGIHSRHPLKSDDVASMLAANAKNGYSADARKRSALSQTREKAVNDICFRLRHGLAVNIPGE